MIKNKLPTVMLTIGELADCAGTNAVTIRYYEKRRLIPISERSEGGHRLYSETLVNQIRFIQNAKLVGFSLEEIHTLLELQQHKNHSSLPVKKMVVEKIQGIDEKISALQNLKNMLTELSCQCDGTAIIEECPILTSLQNDPIKNKRIQKVKK